MIYVHVHVQACMNIHADTNMHHELHSTNVQPLCNNLHGSIARAQCFVLIGQAENGPTLLPLLSLSRDYTQQMYELPKIL